MKQTLVLFENPTAIDDVYKWIENHLSKISILTKSHDGGWVIDLEKSETVIIVPFEKLGPANTSTSWDKIVVFGKIPVEDSVSMIYFRELIKEK